MLKRKLAENELPDGWREEFHDRGDLERAFYLLLRADTAYSHALRGWIRSLQLRSEAAWMHFDRAYAHADEQGKSGRSVNPIQRCLVMTQLQIYCLESIIVDGDEAIDELLEESPCLSFETPSTPTSTELPEEIVVSLPESKEGREILRTRNRMLALRHLVRHEPEEAASILEPLVDVDHIEQPEEAPMDLLRLAVAKGCAVDETLESAAAALENCQCIVARARAAANLSGICRHLGHRQDAERWSDYLHALPAPEATREVFLQRAEVVWQRSTARGQAVVL